MDKREAIEKIVESFDPSGAEELRRIRNMTKEEKRKEYRDICDRIDKGRKEGRCSRRDAILVKKEGRCSRRDAILVKDAMAIYHDQHPNSSDPILLPNLVRGAVIVGLFYFIGNFEKIYQGIIKPTIEYFFK